jgi:hypothetical protein
MRIPWSTIGNLSALVGLLATAIALMWYFVNLHGRIDRLEEQLQALAIAPAISQRAGGRRISNHHSESTDRGMRRLDRTTCHGDRAREQSLPTRCALAVDGPIRLHRSCRWRGRSRTRVTANIASPHQRSLARPTLETSRPHHLAPISHLSRQNRRRNEPASLKSPSTGRFASRQR